MSHSFPNRSIPKFALVTAAVLALSSAAHAGDTDAANTNAQSNAHWQQNALPQSDAANAQDAASDNAMVPWNDDYKAKPLGTVNLGSSSDASFTPDSSANQSDSPQN